MVLQIIAQIETRLVECDLGPYLSCSRAGRNKMLYCIFEDNGGGMEESISKRKSEHFTSKN